MNLANKISVVRMLLIPAYLVLLMWPEGPGRQIHIVAAVVFATASLTDALDGYVARKYNMVTNFGKFFDTLVDKLLTCSAFIALVALGRFPAWAAIIIIARELTISSLRAIASQHGVVIAADTLGKAKTIIQMLGIIYLTLLPIFYFQPMVPTVTSIVVLAAVAITIVSGLDYLVKNKSLFSDA